MESHSQIEDDVAEWLARRDSEHWSDDDEARLQEWIGASAARRVAYLRLKSTWDAAARLRVLRAGMPPAGPGGSVPRQGAWRRSPFFEPSETRRFDPNSGEQPKPISERRIVPADEQGHDREPLAGALLHRRRWLAIAASTLLAATGLAAYQFWGDGGKRYSTPVGGLASLPMSDGSNVTLNTATEIRVAVTETVRRVELEQGEAFFDVARDPTRPFVVLAGNKRIIAVGTKFSVQRIRDDVRVLVTEGKVRLDDAQSAPVLVSAGRMARAGESGVIVRIARPPQVEEILSWREGYLRFHETSLGDAVAEINRYNTRQIFIADPRLAAIRISGTFRPTQYEAFVRVLQNGFSIQAHEAGDRITLTQAP